MSNSDKFPILGSHGKESIPFAIVKAHHQQCMRNHYQTPERLRERGGLSWAELYAVLHDIAWGKRDEADCRKHIQFHLAKGTFNVTSAPQPEKAEPVAMTLDDLRESPKWHARYRVWADSVDGKNNNGSHVDAYQQGVLDGLSDRDMVQADGPAITADVHRDAERLAWIGLQGPEFSAAINADGPGDGLYSVWGMDTHGEGESFIEALDAAIAARAGDAS